VRSAPYESAFKPGQRVSAFTMLGGYAEQVAVSPENIVPTPDHVDDAQAASLLGNYYTMYFALARRGALRPGETVLVLGSGGGIGTAAVQIAKAMGAKVIAMVPPPAGGRVRRVAWRRRGVAAHRRLAAGREGPHRWPRRRPRRGPDRRRGVRRRDPRTGHRRPAAGDRLCGSGIPTVKVNRLLLRNVAVIGVGWGEFVNRNPGAQSLFGSGVAKLVEAGLRPPPPVRFPLSKGAEALESLASGGVQGKLVLEP